MENQTHGTTFEITVHRRTSEGWGVVAETSRPGSLLPLRAEGELRLDLGELARRTTPEAYGLCLGEALFHGALNDAFLRAEAESEGVVRVLLSVEDEELKSLHWQRLSAPRPGGRWGHLALETRAPLSLYLPSLTDRRFPPVGRRDLKALILVASPPGLESFQLDAFDAAAAAANARAALGGIPSDVLASTPEGPLPEALGPATLDALAERLAEDRYTLLHVVAHGMVNRRSGETALFLESSGGGKERVEPVPGEELLKRLAPLGRLPYLTFLATCESAAPQAEAVLGGLGQRLVHRLGLPAVVAMTEKVTLETAGALAANLYQRIGEHGEVDRALAEAAAGLAGRYDVLVPALYTRLAGQPLWTDSLDQELDDDDVARGLETLGSLVTERAPVLAEAFEEAAGVLRRYLGADGLSAAARAERAEALAEVDNLAEEVTDLSFHALALGRRPPAYDARCPFSEEPFRSTERIELRRAMEQQAAQAGLRFEADLANTLLDAVDGEPGAAVVLPWMLRELWRHRHGRWLRGAEYREAATAERVLGDLAERTFPDLSELEQRRARDVFLRLVHLDEEGRGNRRRVEVRRLVPAAEDAAATRAVLARLAGARLVVLGSDSGEEAAELVHEALVTAWPRLQGWLAESRGELRVRDAVGEAARRWIRDGGADTLVHRGERLAEAEAVLRQGKLDWNDEERRYLEACVERQRAEAEAELEAARRLAEESEGRLRAEAERAREAEARARDEARSARRLRRRAVALGVLGAAATALAVLAVFYWHRADEERRMSLARQLAAQSLARHDRPDQALLLAAEATRRLDDDEVSESLLAAIAESPPLESLLQGHTSMVSDVALCTDGRTLASAGRDEPDVLLWDLPERRLRARLAGHTEGVQVLAWKGDGRTLASAGRDGIVILWDAVDGVERGRLPGHAEVVRTLAFSADGATLASGAHDGTIALWDVEALTLRMPFLQAPAAPVYSLAFDPASGVLAAGCGSPGVSLWNASTGEQVGTLPTGDEVVSLAFAPAGRVLAVSMIQQLLFFDAGTGEVLGEPRTHEGVMLDLAWHPTDRLVAGGEMEGAILLWSGPGAAGDASSPRRRLTGHQGMVTSLVWSGDGRRLISGSADTKLAVWDPLRRHTLATTRFGHAAPVTALDTSADGRKIASGAEESVVLVWDVEGEGAPVRLEGTAPAVHAVAFRGDGRRLAAGGADGEVVLWDVGEGTVRGRLAGHSGSVESLAWSGDGRRLASGGADRTILLWDFETGDGASSEARVRARLSGHEGTVSVLAFSDDGATLASAGPDSAIVLWDAAAGRERLRLQGHGRLGVTGAAWLDGGRRLVTVGADARVTIWDATTGEPVGEPLEAALSPLIDLALSGDERFVAASTFRGEVYLWDLESRRRILLSPASTTLSASRVAFSGDSSVLVSSFGTLLAVWHGIEPESWPRVACRRAGRNLTCEEWRRFVGEEPYAVTCPELPPGC